MALVIFMWCEICKDDGGGLKMRPDTLFLVSGLALIGLVAGLGSWAIVSAYDVLPTVDTSREAARTIQSEVYRFGESIDRPIEYSDGTVVPSRTFSIERLNQTSGEWEIIGYSNTHLHKVKVDNTDALDISLGHTDRINPKQN